MMDDVIEKTTAQIRKEYIARIVQLIMECADLDLLDLIFQLLCKCR